MLLKSFLREFCVWRYKHTIKELKLKLQENKWVKILLKI